MRERGNEGEGPRECHEILQHHTPDLLEPLRAQEYLDPLIHGELRVGGRRKGGYLGLEPRHLCRCGFRLGRRRGQALLEEDYLVLVLGGLPFHNSAGRTKPVMLTKELRLVLLRRADHSRHVPDLGLQRALAGGRPPGLELGLLALVAQLLDVCPKAVRVQNGVVPGGVCSHELRLCREELTFQRFQFIAVAVPFAGALLFQSRALVVQGALQLSNVVLEVLDELTTHAVVFLGLLQEASQGRHFLLGPLLRLPQLPQLLMRGPSALRCPTAVTAFSVTAVLEAAALEGC